MAPSSSPAATSADNRRGALAMILSMACFVSGDSLLKIVGRDLPVGELVFFRGLFSSILIIAAGLAMGAFRSLHLIVSPAMIWRTLAEVVSTFLFFSGLVHIAMSDATAIAQTTPLVVTAGAALFLGAQVGWRRWLATLIGLVGVLIIIRPGSSAFNPAALFIVASVLSVTARDLITSRMGMHVPALLILVVSSVVNTVSALFFLPFETWHMPTPEQLVLLAVCAFTVFGGYYGIVVAMRSGEIAVVAPFRYSAVLFGVLSGIVVFGEHVSATTALGIAIVIGAGLYTFHRERVRRREAEAP